MGQVPEKLGKTAVSNIILVVRRWNHAAIFYLHAGQLQMIRFFS